MRDKVKESGNINETRKGNPDPSDKVIKCVDESIFKYFKDLTSEDENIRSNAGLQLLQCIYRAGNDAKKRESEIQYCLKRLVRGVGASTMASRTGFYTTLVAFLQQLNSTEITIGQVLQTIQKELHVGATISNKEDADAAIGQILACAAIIRSAKLSLASDENLKQISGFLIQSARHRTYHKSLAYHFLIELIEKLTSDQFSQAVLPTVQKDLTQPWAKQSIQSVHLLIAARRKHSQLIDKHFFKMYLGGKDLLNDESEQHLVRIFWHNTNSDVLLHPGLEAFGSYLANCDGLAKFWAQHVDSCLENPTKLQEIVSLKITADIFSELNTDKTPAYTVLTPNFVKMIVSGLKFTKSKKDETVKAFYNEFFENLSASCSKSNDLDRVEVIRRLILHPGAFNIEKFTPNRIIHQLIGFLKESGVKEVFKIYKKIFLNRLTKNPENKTDKWLSFERQNAAYTLQHLLSHKSVQTSYKWRQKQLHFFMAIGLFKVDEEGQPCAQDYEGQLNKDFGTHMKNIFYASLQSKMSGLDEEREILMSLVETCNNNLKVNPEKYFRQQIEGKVLKTWKEMYAEIRKIKKGSAPENKLQLVFHILILHMGLQLFRESEMAEEAILDLEKCMLKIRGQKAAHEDADSEPEWIEVVIDLFLHLLSQNNSSLRNVVNRVFPHLTENLTLTAVHQILSVLDMKSGDNPLSSKSNDVNEDDEESENDEEDNSEDDESEDELDGNSSEVSVDNEDDDEENVTDADKLRNAISMALGSMTSENDDQESIDLNELTEEEGNRLNEALSAAFKAMGKSGSASKKSKKYHIETTTLMHFRIRVLDLIDIYLQNSPSLLVCIEIMLALFNMIEACTDDEQKPLQIKVEKTLKKLTAVKAFGSTADVSEENLVSFIRLIAEHKTHSVNYEVQNRLKNKCCIFLITSAKLINPTERHDQIISVLTEYLENFIKSRNPIVNISLFNDIFKLRWQGIWNLAETLSEKGLCESTRTFRRIQVIELLTLVYKNHDLLTSVKKDTKNHLKCFENVLGKHIETLVKSASISVKEFNVLLDLLFAINRACTKLNLSIGNQPVLNAKIQEIRSRLKLDSTQSYNRFCNTFGLKPLKNPQHLQNGGENNRLPKIESQGKVQCNEQGERKTKRKQRDEAVFSNKLKKIKKEERMTTLSQGLNGGFNFDDTLDDVVMADGSPHVSSNEDEPDS